MTLSDGSKNDAAAPGDELRALPPDTRKHRDQSPFGTYDYGGAHYCCSDYDKIGPLYVKLGMRYGMFSRCGGVPPQVRSAQGERAEDADQDAVEQAVRTGCLPRIPICRRWP